MGRRSKKKKSHKKQQGASKKSYSLTENLGYYFLAAAGLFVLIFIIVGLLGYLKIL